MNEQEIIRYYENRYHNSFVLKMILHQDQKELEHIKDVYWHKIGLYKVLGYNRHGVTFRLMDNEKNDNHDVEYLEWIQELNQQYDWQHTK